LQLWTLRRHCLQLPNILPRLLDAVRWNSRDDMTHIYLLLQEWPRVRAHGAERAIYAKHKFRVARHRATGLEKILSLLLDVTRRRVTEFSLFVYITLK
jgi:hypothetical protein